MIEESDRAMAAKYDTWSQRIEQVRQKAAQLIGASPEEVAFVKSTSHGLNHVAQGLSWSGGENVVSYDHEFPSNIYPWKNLASKGVQLRMVGDKAGVIEPAELEKAIDANTRLVTISSVEFASGYRNNLKAISRVCREKGVLLCVDAIQSLGALALDVKRDGIDFLSADAHKWLLGPEGVGIFYVSKELLDRLNPAYVGWHSVKNASQFLPYHFDLKEDAAKFEEGSHNLMGIFALGGCLSLFEEIGIDRIEKRIIEITDYLVTGLEKRGFKIKTPRDKLQQKSGIVLFESPGDPAEIVSKLAEKKIYITARNGLLRASPHFYNTEDEIDQLLVQF